MKRAEWLDAASAAAACLAAVLLALALFFCQKGAKPVAYDGCRVGGSMVVPNATPTAGVFTGADFDAHPPYWLNGAGQPQAVRVVFAGKHRVKANGWSAGGVVGVSVLVNGAAAQPTAASSWGDVLNLAASDQITLQLYQSSGGPLNVSFTLSVHFEGP